MNLHRFPLRMLTSAVMLALPIWVHAAGLGKLTVNSALGQPFSAEIELLVDDKSEFDSLKANLASGQAFKDAQVEYASVLSALQFSVEKRPDGRPILKLTSSEAVHDPFLDMLIELNWASGRLLREYTVLLDPPGMAVPQTVAPAAVSAPVVKSAATPVPAKATSVKTTPAKVVPTKAAPVKVAPMDEPAPPAEPQETVAEEQAALSQAAKPQPAQAAQVNDQANAPIDSFVRVKRGDTLSAIANNLRPAEVSLEEALVGLFRENPQAFDGKNINRLKAGVTLKIPSEKTMEGIDAKSANREVRLQAADWQAYRAKLAERVAAEPAPGAEKKPEKQVSTGKITSKVEDKAQAKADSKDVLKLSRNVPPSAATVSSAQAKQSDKAAQDKAAQEKSAAASKLAAEKAAADKAIAEQEERTAREKAGKEAAERTAMLEKQIADMQKLAQMKDAAPAANGAQTAPVPVAPKVAVNPPVEQAQASWMDSLTANPLYWLGGLAAALLGGVLWWMMAGGRRRKSVVANFDDSLLTGGELSPSSLAASASGGTINTGDTSFLTDFSQAGLATVDTQDVDPIAEADVYMAYGRDAQAEEILREALAKSPNRHEIRLKLLEIHAARKNVTAFGSVAGELYAALGGQTGAIWDKAAELGRSIDPTNALYGGGPNAVAAQPVVETPLVAVKNETIEPERLENAGAVLDFNLDLDLSAIEPDKPENVPVLHPEEPVTIDHSLDFDLSGLDIKVPDSAPENVPAPMSAGSMDFSGLDLNLEDMGGDDMDEVATKLDLARAYLEMGDKEGTREILQEVLNEGNDSQKTDARSIMSGL